MSQTVSETPGLFGTKTRREALQLYERYTELPLLLLALAIIPLIVLPLVFDLDSSVNDAFFALDWIIWAVFAVDLGVRTYIVQERRKYLIAHWYDVIIVVVPFLRPLRILRSARALRLMRLTRVVAFATHAFAEEREFARRRGAVYVMSLALVLLVASSALIFAFERGSDGQIDDFGTALWWGVATITTVGYGDVVPVTPEGRAVAILLMLVGISLFGFLTATIAAFMVEHDSKASLDDVMAKLESMERQLADLKRGNADDQSPH
jgi:voltage-gated potassium channel